MMVKLKIDPHSSPLSLTLASAAADHLQWRPLVASRESLSSSSMAGEMGKRRFAIYLSLLLSNSIGLQHFIHCLLIRSVLSFKFKQTFIMVRRWRTIRWCGFGLTELNNIKPPAANDALSGQGCVINRWDFERWKAARYFEIFGSLGDFPRRVIYRTETLIVEIWNTMQESSQQVLTMRVCLDFWLDRLAILIILI
jgi:hypothetical protein